MVFLRMIAKHYEVSKKSPQICSDRFSKWDCHIISGLSDHAGPLEWDQSRSDAGKFYHCTTGPNKCLYEGYGCCA